MAELKASKSIEIKASAEKVWEVMARIESWPDWIPVIISAKAAKGEPLSLGSSIKFKPRLGPIPLNLTVKIVESDKPKRLAWGGGGPGVSAIHSFNLEEKDGVTKLTSSEVFTGFGVPLLKLVMGQADLDNLHEVWIAGYKKAAEK
jgi:hypothetical protein